MIKTIHAIVRDGRIELTDAIRFPEGTKLLVTPVNDETDFWVKSAEFSLDEIWDNPEDDAYAELLKK